METRLVPEAGFPIKTVDVRGFQRRLTLKNMGRNLSAAVHAVTAGQESARILRDFRPDIAIGTGGYVSGPILRKAAKMGIPVVVHESNAFPGVTVKMLAKYAVILLADESARKYLPAGAKAIVTGNPLRPGFLNMDKGQARKELGLDERPLILSFGGSLGAERLNETMAEVLRRSHEKGAYQHIHGTGKKGYDAFCARLKEKGVPLQGEGVTVRDYIDDMPRCMAAADLVISRCGAMTLSELPAAGKASILIPSPNVAENHQYHNAMALVNKGAALCIEEKDLTPDSLWEAIEKAAGHPDVLQKMAEAARRCAILDASERIYAVIRDILAGKDLSG